MNRYLFPYSVSVGLHAIAFLLLALITNNHHSVPPVEIDFTVCSAHAEIEQPLPAPAAPKSTGTAATKPSEVLPLRPQPRPMVEPVQEQSVQHLSDVAVAEIPHAPPPMHTVQTASVAPTTGKHHEGAKTTAGSTTGTDEKVASEHARAKYVKEQFTYIRDKIASHVRYPRHARRMGWSGTVHVSFVIEESGTVSDVRVVRSSQVSLLDDAALDSVRRSAPFPRPPVRARIVIPVEYVLG
jgi:protein TonB